MDTQPQTQKNHTLATRARGIYRCWRALPQAKEKRDVPSLVDFAYSHTIAPIQIRSELVELGEIIAKARPERALEIGTARGGTLFLLCQLAAPDATIISLDLPHGAFGGGYSPLRIPLYKRFAGPAQSLHLLRADSHSEATCYRVMEILDGDQLDYLFIDADHTYDGVNRDFEMYSPLVRKGGIIAFHDITQEQGGCEVPRFWNDLKHDHGKYTSYREIVGTPGEAFGIGVLVV